VSARTRAVVAALCAVVVTGCIEGFDPPSLITKSRPIGARVEVAGDADRPWPAPGEVAAVRWLVVGPEEPDPLTWGFVVCPAILTPTGDRFCAGEPFGFGFSAAPAVAEPTLSFTVPPAEALGPLEEILVLGIICVDGTPAIDMEPFDVRCEGDGAQGTLVTFAIPLALEGRTNRSPTIPADAITFDDGAWAEPVGTVPLEGCASVAGGTELPSVRAGADPVVLHLQPVASDREIYTVGDQMGRETLTFSHFVTSGELERQFSVVDDDTADVTVEWTPPAVEDVSADGTRVRFHFVVRDGRGGIAWTARELCVAP